MFRLVLERIGGPGPDIISRSVTVTAPLGELDHADPP